MATDSLFKQLTTATGFFTDAPNLALGVQATAHIALSLTAIWWSPRSATAGTVSYGIFNGNTAGAGAAVATGTLNGYNPNSTWQRFPITPVAISAGADFMVTVSVPNGHYSTLGSQFPVDDAVVRGVTGCFNGSGNNRPDNNSSLSYMIDFEATYTDQFTGAGIAVLGGITGVGAGVRTKLGSGVANLGALLAAGVGTAVGSVSANPRIVSSTSSARIVSTNPGGRL